VFPRSRSETQTHGARISTATPSVAKRNADTRGVSRLQLSPVAKRNADTQGTHLDCSSSRSRSETQTHRARTSTAIFLFLNRSSPRFLLFFYRLPKTKSPLRGSTHARTTSKRDNQLRPPFYRLSHFFSLCNYFFMSHHIFFASEAIYKIP
jgi:hypothetical protein